MTLSKINTRVRIHYSKLGKIRFTSHRDVARIWERALRRAQLPVAVTEGFSPRAKLHFGLALATSQESLAEYLDADFTGDNLSADELLEVLNGVLPEGLTAHTAVVLPSGVASLQQAVTSCDWEMELVDVTVSELAGQVRRVCDAETLPVVRQQKGKQVTHDIAPRVLSLEVTGSTPRGACLAASLGTQPRAVRPVELLEALGHKYRPALIRRTRQWIEQDGARLDPIEVGAAPATRTLAGVR